MVIGAGALFALALPHQKDHACTRKLGGREYYFIKFVVSGQLKCLKKSFNVCVLLVESGLDVEGSYEEKEEAQ